MPLHDVLTTLAALVAVLAMILLAKFGARLVGLAPGHGAPQGLVRGQGQRLLLLTGGPSDVMLGWLPASPAPQRDNRE